VIKAAGVVIPAHNEQDLLPSCLTAVRHAASQAGVPVYLAVVADACTDRTAAVARAHGADVVELSTRCVGAARQVGVRQVLRATCHTDPAAVWIATTDADTRVPRWWLRRQLGFAAQGWKGVLGTVTVADWIDHPARCNGCTPSATAPGGYTIRTSTAPTWESPRTPTSRPAVSGRCPRARTTP
jgi:glycosyltransferase involved in cell wall biosynthesis